MAAPPKTTAAFVNWRGEPLDPHSMKPVRRARPTKPKPKPKSPPPASPAAPPQPADLETVFDALALAGCARSKTWLLQFLRRLRRPMASGVAYDAAAVGAALAALLRAGRVAVNEGGRYDIPEAVRLAAWPRLLSADGAAGAWRAWAWASAPYASPDGDEEPPMPAFHNASEMVALSRLALYAGLNLAQWRRIAARVLGPAAGLECVAQALNSPFMPALFVRNSADLREALLTNFHATFDLDAPLWTPLLRWLDAQLERQPSQVPPALRLLLAERRLHRGDIAGSQAAVAGLEGPGVPLLHAAQLAYGGRWVEAARAFDKAWREVAKAARARRGRAPERLTQWYVLSLLAQTDPGAWKAAHKLCVAESGTRTPAPEGWGLWAHAIAVRLGDATLRAGVLDAPPPQRLPHVMEADAHRLILAAWLDQPSRGWSASMLRALIDHLHDSGVPWKADLLRQAGARLALPLPPRSEAEGEPWKVEFYGARREPWQDALAAIEALGEVRAKDGAATEPATLQWRLTLDKYGRVVAVQPWEQPQGVRGPGKARPVSLARVSKATRLDPRDGAVARCIAPQRWSPGLQGIDVTAAAIALVGHPAVFFDDAPDQVVDLREGLPVLEVQRQTGAEGERFVFHLADALLAPTLPDPGEEFTSSDETAESQRRDSIRIVRDGADRARLIRIGAAQRRVAELVSKQWSVPVTAQAELEAALRVLAGHFQLHSDAAAGQAVASESRLRAQLSPRGEGLLLRLLVQPFGSHGPAVVPGHGRARLLTLHGGLNLSTERDLAAETRHLDSVLEALPFLDGTQADESSWLLEDPEDALAAVERLPQLPGVAGIDWPRGKPVRVLPLATAGLQVSVKSGADWFAVDGEIRIDEQRVLGLQKLLQLAHDSRGSRFVALGDGEYLSLTEQLKRQLADLHALAQAESAGKGGGLRLPAAAAAWLAETLQDTEIAGDKPWTRRLALLDEAAALQPPLPPALQAELRSYQHEGFAWMARLAHAGLGACLADDMGLGKTVQTLALLLHRAALGPALVIAPTSVCSNWVAEAQRFAPSLRVALYGEGERASLLEGVAAGDLVVASYALTQIDEEAFAKVPWATLVLDEAQALKNAATKRAKSVASLQAGFRLALTGTPVENRLADLWSIMNLLNPGLLGSSGQFSERFAGPIERERDNAAQSRLRRLVAPFLLRRTKSQVLTDLPPRTEIIHRVEPGPEERAFLEASRRAALERVAEMASDTGPGQAAFHVLAELTRLRRAACDPRLVAPELGIVGAKSHEFELLASEIVAGRHKALVFSQFTDFLKLLASRLDAAGLSYQYLDGSTPAAERGKRVVAFQRGEGDLFLISLKAGGFGLNLTAADYVLIVDPWWNPAAEDQALGRAHRMGQLRPVTVYRLVTAGSVEERIVELHRDKRLLADGILEGQDSAAPLGAAELSELLRGD
jgi:superfamily II DNA or RNA helicase